MSALVLIVEDEPKLSSVLQDYLQQSQYRTEIIDNGLDVSAYVRAQQPDLIILDLMLPGKDGLQVCKEVRSFSDVPIIMVTAKVEEIDRLLGLELGADDYICKPFSPREVVARVKNVLRRMQAPEPSSSLSDADRLVLDKDSYCVKYGGLVLSLTSVEFELLNTMLGAPGKIFSRDQLMDRIYADHRVVSGRTIDSHITKLRKKLSELSNEDGAEREWIVSIYGVGYKIEINR
ncbi:MAG: response regulator [Gammaproteobacteria bacterium]